MNATTPRLPWVERYRIIMLAGTSVQKLGAVYLAMFVGFVAVLPLMLLIPGQSGVDKKFVITFALISTVIVALVIAPFILKANKRQVAAVNDCLQMTVSKDDLTILSTWLRYGIPPKQRHLHAVMPRYLAYVEATVRGQGNGVSVKKWSQLFYLNVVCIVLFVFSLGFSILARTPINWFNVVLIGISSINAVNMYYMKQAQLSPLISFTNRKYLRCIKQRRAELGIAHTAEH